jgi:hypothetical protein
MIARRWLALSLATLGFFLGTWLYGRDPRTGAPTRRLDPQQPILSDPSVKYDYDIVYVRAPRKGDDRQILWVDVFQPLQAEPGSDLVLLHPDGRENVLVAAKDDAVADPFVSFDGEWVYYALIHNVAGGMEDEKRPTVAVTYPQAGSNTEFRVLFGLHDYDSGVDLNSLRVVADFAVDGKPAGQNLVGEFQTENARCLGDAAGASADPLGRRHFDGVGEGQGGQRDSRGMNLFRYAGRSGSDGNPSQRKLNFMKLSALVIMLLPALSAQNTGLNGIWVAPINMAGGPNFFAYTFKVDGDTFTGAISDMGEPAKPFSDGKIENGHISFSLPKQERYYTGTLKDPTHLELQEELHYTGYKGIRRPGAPPPPDKLSGEWVLEGRVDMISFILDIKGDKLGGEIVDRKVTHEPIFEGTVTGNEISFRYLNGAHLPMLWTAKLVGDHLEMISDLKRPLHAVRIAESGTGFGGTPRHTDK